MTCSSFWLSGYELASKVLHVSDFNACDSECLRNQYLTIEWNLAKYAENIHKESYFKCVYTEEFRNQIIRSIDLRQKNSSDQEDLAALKSILSLISDTIHDMSDEPPPSDVDVQSGPSRTILQLFSTLSDKISDLSSGPSSLQNQFNSFKTFLNLLEFIGRVPPYHMIGDSQYDGVQTVDYFCFHVSDEIFYPFFTKGKTITITEDNYFQVFECLDKISGYEIQIDWINISLNLGNIGIFSRISSQISAYLSNSTKLRIKSTYSASFSEADCLLIRATELVIEQYSDNYQSFKASYLDKYPNIQSYVLIFQLFKDPNNIILSYRGMTSPLIRLELYQVSEAMIPLISQVELIHRCDQRFLGKDFIYKCAKIIGELDSEKLGNLPEDVKFLQTRHGGDLMRFKELKDLRYLGKDMAEIQIDDSSARLSLTLYPSEEDLFMLKRNTRLEKSLRSLTVHNQSLEQSFDLRNLEHYKSVEVLNLDAPMNIVSLSRVISGNLSYITGMYRITEHLKIDVAVIRLENLYAYDLQFLRFSNKVKKITISLVEFEDDTDYILIKEFLVRVTRGQEIEEIDIYCNSLTESVFDLLEISVAFETTLEKDIRRIKYRMVGAENSLFSL
jgi:hypothetical protein